MRHGSVATVAWHLARLEEREVTPLYAPVHQRWRCGERWGAHMRRIARYQNTRYWAVIETDGTLVCLCVYRKGAQEVVKRLQAREKEEA